MKNFIGEVPYELPANIVSPVRVETNDYKDFSLAIYVGRRRRPLPLARLTLWHNGDVELVQSRHLSSHVQVSAWNALVRAFGGIDNLPVKVLTVSHSEGA